MLVFFAILFAIVLVVAATIQATIAIWFGRTFRKKRSVTMPPDRQTKAAVIVSVRGCDPSLQGALIGVLNQDYADYCVHLVVDHRTDQAWDFVQQIKAEHDSRNRLFIHELVNPRETCSLKCHAIVQALDHLAKNTEYIALLDADVTPHPNWLADLTGPLQDPQVGGVTGNQWFEPAPRAGIGSMTRSTWNGGALVPTILFANPWAGSFAMRAADVVKSRLPTIWSRSAVDDGPIRQAINEIGLRVEFAPSLIMVNRETCTFAYVNRWITRMLTWSRMYEETFFLSVIHALFSNTVMLGNFLVLALAISWGNGIAAGIAAMALVVSGLLCGVAYVSARNCVVQSCQMRGDQLEELSFVRFFAAAWTSPIAHLAYGVSCFRALLLRRIKWREITYEINGSEIKRLDYQPYAAKDGAESNVSI